MSSPIEILCLVKDSIILKERLFSDLFLFVRDIFFAFILIVRTKLRPLKLFKEQKIKELIYRVDRNKLFQYASTFPPLFIIAFLKAFLSLLGISSLVIVLLSSKLIA